MCAGRQDTPRRAAGQQSVHPTSSQSTGPSPTAIFQGLSRPASCPPPTQSRESVVPLIDAKSKGYSQAGKASTELSPIEYCLVSSHLHLDCHSQQVLYKHTYPHSGSLSGLVNSKRRCNSTHRTSPGRRGEREKKNDSRIEEDEGSVVKRQFIRY